jgi:protein-S-isoprenylcysteine O-methyltransferase Ste14
VKHGLSERALARSGRGAGENLNVQPPAEAGSRIRALSLFGLILMVGGMLGLYFSHSLFSPWPAVIAVQGAAVVLMAWARATLGRRSFHATADPTAGGLVTAGPYRFIRHPIYTAACLFGWAGAAGHWSARSALLGGLLFAGALVRMLCEERLVSGQYPEYREYARTTKRMVPYVF